MSSSFSVYGSGEGSIEEYWDVKDEGSDSGVERLSWLDMDFLPAWFSLVGRKGSVF